MKCVLVIEKDGSVRQRIPYDTKNGAIIYLYDKESRIVWESVEGRHYTDSIPYETNKDCFMRTAFCRYVQKICSIYRILESGAGERKTGLWEKIQAKGIDSFEDKDAFLRFAV